MKKRNLLLGLALLGAVSAFAQDDATTPTVVSVPDLAAYEGTDPFVFNQKDNKTYALNNLGEYEVYGVYEKVTTTELRTKEDRELAELKAPDGAYINLGYKPKTTTRIEAVFAAVDGPEWKALYGTRFQANSQDGVEFPGDDNYSAGNGWKHGFAFFTTNGAINLGDEKVEKGKISPYFGQKIKTIQNATTGNLVIYTGDDFSTPVDTIKDVPLSKDCGTDLYLFAINKHLPIIAGYNENPDQFGANDDPCYNPYVTLYSLKIYEDETLKYDLVPYLKDGKSGLKDNESGTFFGSANDKLFAVSAEAGITAYPGKVVYNTADKHYYKYNETSKVYEDLGGFTDAEGEYSEILDTEYKNLKNWRSNEDHWNNVFGNGDNIEWNAATATNTIAEYIGTGGYEPLYYTQEVEPNRPYTISFKYTNLRQWESWGGDDFRKDFETEEAANVPDYKKVLLPFKIVDGTDFDETNCHVQKDVANFLGGVGLTYKEVTDEEHTIEFTSTTGKATFIIQFGTVDDGDHDYGFKFSDIKIKIEGK